MRTDGINAPSPIRDSILHMEKKDFDSEMVYDGLTNTLHQILAVTVNLFCGASIKRNY